MTGAEVVIFTGAVAKAAGDVSQGALALSEAALSRQSKKQIQKAECTALAMIIDEQLAELDLRLTLRFSHTLQASISEIWDDYLNAVRRDPDGIDDHITARKMMLRQVFVIAQRRVR